MSTTPYLNPDEAIKQAALAWRPGQPAIAPYQAAQGLNLPPVGGKLGAPQIPEEKVDTTSTVPLPAKSVGNLAPRGTLEGDKAEVQRLSQNGAGLNQIQNPIMHGAAKVGDVLGSILAPGLTAKIPGTTLHNQVLLGQANRAVTGDEANAEKEAQTANLAIQPELKQAKAQLEQDKLDETQRQHENTLHEHGYKTGPDGNIVPLTYDEMNPNQQAVHDLKGAQEEEQEAQAALKKAQADPNSPAFRLAQQRIENAKQTRQIALQRLGLSQATFDARYHGTDTQGNALPGAMITDDGQPVGSSFSQNVRPTGTERNKADMAGSAKEQLNDIKAIVAKRPDIFGPVAGRTTDFQVWLGSQDPDAQAFRTARTIAGDHLAGTFGGRSEAALDALDKAIGQFKDNPAAMQRGLDQLVHANERFLKAGNVRTQGSNVNREASAAPTFKVKLSDAMSLPQNKGKSEKEVEADVKKHGGEVVR